MNSSEDTDDLARPVTFLMLSCLVMNLVIEFFFFISWRLSRKGGEEDYPVTSLRIFILAKWTQNDVIVMKLKIEVPITVTWKSEFWLNCCCYCCFQDAFTSPFPKNGKLPPQMSVFVRCLCKVHQNPKRWWASEWDKNVVQVINYLFIHTYLIDHSPLGQLKWT